MAEGDTRAFEIVYETYRDKTYGFLFDLTGSQPLAEDIFQDVFTNIWEQRAGLTEVGNFNAWLFTMLRNKAFDGLRRVAKEHAIIREMLKNGDATQSATDEKLHYSELRKKLHLAVNRLPGQQRQVYLLSREKGLKHEEIATNLNIAVTTVNKHMTRALDFLRKNLPILF